MMATTKGKCMNLTHDVVTWPATHYVFIEKIGPFQGTAPQAWKDLHQLVPRISEHNKITAYMSLYKVGPKVYRAGVSLAAGPSDFQVQPLCFDRTLYRLARSMWPRF
jgi:hypothetical protein